MKKSKYIAFILIIIFLISFTACTNKNDIVSSNTSNDKIQLWYNFDYNPYEEELTYALIDNAKKFCDLNNIPLEIVKYDNEILSYEDYAFKRNLAAENGNMIIIDSISYLSDLAKHHADYAKIKIYDNLLSPYKDRFCIPIGRSLKASFIDNAILDFYNIDTPERPAITYPEYLEIKQKLKNGGARFETNKGNFYETIRYYLYINGLLYVNKNDETLKDNIKLKEALKMSIYGMCEDITLYNDASLNEFEKIIRVPSKGFEIYDSNSNLHLKEFQNCDNIIYLISPQWFKLLYNENKNPSTKTYIIDYFGANELSIIRTPGIFIHKKITNDKIFDLTNFVLEKSSYIYGKNNDIVSAPLLYTNKILKELKLNENLEYIGEDASEEEKRIINVTFDIFAKDEVKSKEIADAYFSDNVIVKSIETLIYDTIYEIAEKLSESSSENGLSLRNFDSEDEKINKLVDEKIDEFMKQLILEIN